MQDKSASHLFDEAVEYTTETIRISTPGRALLRVQREPQQRALCGIRRAIHAVNDPLLSLFRALVSGQADWPLYLYGDVGTGKTLAGVALCDHVVESFYATVERMATATVEKNESLWSTVYAANLAVLDEIGARQRDSDLHYGAIQRFADNREHKERVAIFISNLKPSELADLYDDRIADRLLCGTVFQLQGKSRR